MDGSWFPRRVDQLEALLLLRCDYACNKEQNGDTPPCRLQPSTFSCPERSPRRVRPVASCGKMVPTVGLLLLTPRSIGRLDLGVQNAQGFASKGTATGGAGTR